MPRPHGQGRRRAERPVERTDDPADPADRALARAAQVVGDRWSLVVVSRLMRGPHRFGELLAEIDGLAPNILARRLGRLEADGLVVGEPYSTRPLRHAYRLTAAGTELAGALRMLTGWAALRQGAGPGRGEGIPTHGPCGSPLDVRWFCSTCDVVVDEPAPGDGPPSGDDLVWL